MHGAGCKFILRDNWKQISDIMGFVKVGGRVLCVPYGASYLESCLELLPKLSDVVFFYNMFEWSQIFTCNKYLGS